MNCSSKWIACAAAALLLTGGAIVPAQAFAVWQGTAVIESTTGTGCGESGIIAGTPFRVFFKPRNVGGNSGGSEMLFVYERGSFQIRRLNADLSGSGTYDGSAVFFNLHNAGAFAFDFNKNSTNEPFDITIAPSTFDATTQDLKITGSISVFFVLATGSTSDCDVTFRANLLQKP